jgi:hypothetical protein
MRSIEKLSAAAVLCLLVAGCGGGAATMDSSTTARSTGSPATSASDGGSSAFTSGYLKFERATNVLARKLTPLEDGVTENSGDATGMSKAFIKLGETEKSLADNWHPALVAFEALKPPPSLAKVSAATAADASKLYASLRTISSVVHATSGSLTAGQFIAASKGLQAFATHARALAGDLESFDKRLGVG